MVHLLSGGMSKPKPPEPMLRKTVTLPESVWTEVEGYRLSQGIGSQMETLRRLVQAGLRAERKRPLEGKTRAGRQK